MKCIRFGEIPENEKSINWLKISLSDREYLSELAKIDINQLYEEAENLNCLEDGVSVFELSESGIVLDNFQLLKDFASRYTEKYYIVSGDKVGTGNDGEPLLKNITILKDSVDLDFYKIIIGEIEKHYPIKIKSDSYSDKIYEFFDFAKNESYIAFGDFEFYKK